MEIFYYPEGAKTIEDRISVGDLVKALVGETRKKHAKEIKRARLMSPTCQCCGERALQYRSLEAHHVKPLWVSALEIVMTAPPQNYQEYREMFYRILAGKFSSPLPATTRSNSRSCVVTAITEWSLSHTRCGKRYSRAFIDWYGISATRISTDSISSRRTTGQKGDDL